MIMQTGKQGKNGHYGTTLDHSFFGEVLFSDASFLFLKSDVLCDKLTGRA